jgi:arsenical pump membrane protein
VLLEGARIQSALSQAWPPFVLVTGLLAIGQVAGADGLFEAAAARLERLPGSPTALLLACFGLVSMVTALLNLDTSAVFLTPVLIGVARRRGIDHTPFLYGSVFMANASSLFLPGSNLTNLLVLQGRGGGSFFTHMLPAALIAPALTAAGLVLLHRRRLLRAGTRSAQEGAPLEIGAGLFGASVAAVLMVALSNPALPVLAVAALTVCWDARSRGRAPARYLAALGLPALFGLFALSVALGTIARAGSFPADLLHSPSALATSAVAAGASVLVNNLPAAVLLSSSGRLHAEPLLIGLDLGPNLAVTGSLAVLLWWRAARAAGVRPSVLSYSRQGLVLAPLAILGAVLIGSG